MRCALILLAACGGSDSPTAVERPVEAAAAPMPPPCTSDVAALGAGLTAEQRPLDATPATPGPACLDLVRADLAHYRLRVLTAARDGGSHPAPVWRERFHLAATINAGMFHAEGGPVGMIVEDGVAIAADNKKYGGFLAFDPRGADPPAVLVGRDCPHFDLADLRKRYRAIVQAPRLLGCNGEAVPWQDRKQYSAAVIAIDRLGRVVLVHARAAVTMTELSRALAKLELAGALFLEGGPEASLVVQGSDGALSRVGSYETGFVENDANRAFWWLPNVIGLEALLATERDAGIR